MEIWSLRLAATMVANAMVFFLSTMALPAATAIVEHTFVVSMIQSPSIHACMAVDSIAP
jgi:laccase